MRFIRNLIPDRAAVHATAKGYHRREDRLIRCLVGDRAEGEGEMTMRVLLVLAAIGFSATAFAQSAPPKVGNKPLAQLKPKEPMGCKLVGTVKGTKLWAGDCVTSELRGAAPAKETDLPAAAAGAIPPGQKQ
jgi:hypothetical protein